MRFLYPSMLWALTAILIPIAVHLFNLRRYKLVYFSNTNILKNIQQENAKTKKLKYWVVLSLRCLFIIALVLAFAFPYHPTEQVNLDADDMVVGVYVDNSMSMKALSDKSTLLEDARESARNLVRQCPPATRFLLMTNSFEIRNEYPMNQEEILDQLDRMSLEGPPVRLNEVMDRFVMLRQHHGFGPSALFLFSDFQTNTVDLSDVQQDTSMRVFIVPIQAEIQSNLSIDTLWLGSPVVQPGLANEVHVLIRNRGGKAVKGMPVNLIMDGRTVASTTVDVEASGEAEAQFQMVPPSSGSIPCAVSLTDYPITFDDVSYFVIEPRQTLQVVELSRARKPTPVSMVFSDDPQFSYTLMHPDRVDLHGLARAQLVVVDATSDLNETLLRALAEQASGGASVMLFHDDGATVDTNTMGVSDLALRHAFFEDLILEMPQHPDLPLVKRHVRLSPAPNSVVLMHLDNGDPLMTAQQQGRGRLYEMATTLDEQWSTLSDNALLVPMMLKMAFLGGGVGQTSYTLGQDQFVQFDDLTGAGDMQLKLRKEDLAFETVPSMEMRNNRMCLFFHDDLPEAGFYELTRNDSVCHVMAWNDSRLESELEFADNEVVVSALREAGFETATALEADDFAGRDLMRAMARHSMLWRWLVLAALLALAAEVLVLRLWK